MTYQKGDLLWIIGGGTSKLGVQDPNNYHFLKHGTLVKVLAVQESRKPPEWGTPYRVKPVEDTPDVWIEARTHGHQVVYDCHVMAPHPTPATIADIESFLES